MKSKEELCEIPSSYERDMVLLDYIHTMTKQIDFNVQIIKRIAKRIVERGNGENNES